MNKTDDSMGTTGVTPKARWLYLPRSLVIGIIFVVSACPIALYLFKLYAQQRVHRELQWARDKGYPLSAAEFDEYMAVPQQDDGTALVLKALELLPKLKLSQDRLKALSYLKDYETVSADIQAKPRFYGRLLAQYEAVFAAMDEAARKKRFYFVPVSQEWVEGKATAANQAVFRGITDVAVKLHIRAVSHFLENRPEKAAQDIEQLLGVSRILAQQPWPVNQAMACSMRASAADLSLRLCEMREVTVQLLRRLAKGFESASQEKPRMALCPLEERVLFLQVVNGLKGTATKKVSGRQPGTFYLEVLLPLDEAFFLKQLRLTQQMLEVSHATRVRKYRNPDGSWKVPEEVPEYYILSLAMLSEIMPDDCSDPTRMRLAAIGLRLYANRLEGRPYPSDLSAIPAPLSEDPYSNESLLLKRQDDKLVVYSVGFNCQDDGGDYTVDPDDNCSTNGDDVCFWVPWLPQ